MGGRGTYAAGNNVSFTYETVDKIAGVKVLKGIGIKHGLPEEAHASSAYIKVNPDGTFREMRFYDKDHYLTLELAYHREDNIGKKGQPVLHYHTYDRNFNRSAAKKATRAMKKRYQKYLRGVKL